MGRKIPDSINRYEFDHGVDSSRKESSWISWEFWESRSKRCKIILRELNSLNQFHQFFFLEYKSCLLQLNDNGVVKI